MPLTETQAKNAKPRERAYKLADSEGLFLLVQPNGTKLWRMKYRFAGKEKLLSFWRLSGVGDRRRPGQTQSGQGAPCRGQGSNEGQGGGDIGER